jgi:hypothetical protein
MAEAVQEKMAAVSLDPVAERKPYYQKRIDLFSQYAEREKAQVEAARAAGVAIKVVLPDASVKQGIKGATTPLDIANEISKSLAKKCVVAKVDGQTWDLFRPLEGDCALQLHSFDDPDGREVRRVGCWGALMRLPGVPRRALPRPRLGANSRPCLAARGLCRPIRGPGTLRRALPRLAAAARGRRGAGLSPPARHHPAPSCRRPAWQRHPRRLPNRRPSGTRPRTCWARRWSSSTAWT